MSHYPSEIILICWFADQETIIIIIIIIIINVEISYAASIFVETMIQNFFDE